MYVSLRLGSFFRLLTAIAVGAVIIGVILARPATHEEAPADVVPPQVDTTVSAPAVPLEAQR